MTSVTDYMQLVSRLGPFNRQFMLAPELWVKWGFTNLNWTPLKFERSNQSLVPANQVGLYAFVVVPHVSGAALAGLPDLGYVMYVGKTQNSFHKRFTSYLNEQRYLRRPLVTAMLNIWKDNIWFYFAPIAPTEPICDMETALIDALIPPMNDEFSAELGAAIKVLR